MTPTQIIARAKDLSQAKATAGRFTNMLEALQTPAKSNLAGEKEAAVILEVTPGTLKVWRSTGRYAIPFLKVGRLAKYRRSTLENWLESRTRLSGATQ